MQPTYSGGRLHIAHMTTIGRPHPQLCAAVGPAGALAMVVISPQYVIGPLPSQAASVAGRRSGAGHRPKADRLRLQHFVRYPFVTPTPQHVTGYVESKQRGYSSYQYIVFAVHYITPKGEDYMYITIDPGHSGPIEPGACCGNLCECDVVLDISLSLAALLRTSGHEVILTRSTDIETDDLAFRAQLANDQPADVFVSIHVNAAENPAAKGTEVYCYPGSTRGAYLADCIRKQIIAFAGTVDRGTKEANFQVLRQTNAPAVLVECGFITNDSDRRTFDLLAGRAAYAAAIYKGLQEFLGE